jgi:hypothetical protein
VRGEIPCEKLCDNRGDDHSMGGNSEEDRNCIETRIIDDIAPTSNRIRMTIQIFPFAELFAMQGELDCELDPRLCAIEPVEWVLHLQ